MFNHTSKLTEEEKVIKICLHFKDKELDSQWERPLLRAFYWSAYYGKQQMIDMMINEHLWSPFMTSFEKKDCLMGAVIGDQVEIVASLLSSDFVGYSRD
jgi:hypothetical protein